ncbi:TIGR02281 family clan AA aspartic protease [Endozoicomonas lisbonensis]|uniref:Aspartyl protease family protein n=1 Tax=Endozoicomonas lisbonensis TaxID=3120522 RepID=A0ABV2SFQ0_9GAMM
MRTLFSFLLSAFLLAGAAYSTATVVRVVALFPDRAMVNINGQRHLLRVGGRAVSGVRLIDAHSRMAVLEIDGRKQKFSLSRDTSGGISDPEVKSLRITRSNNGQYIYQGSINGRRIDMLLDTGANVVALNSRDADRLGIRFRDGEKVLVDTASDTVSAYRITLSSVSLGGIRVNNVEATILEGSYPDKVLLGMSFLRYVRFSEDRGVMVLEAKF